MSTTTRITVPNPVVKDVTPGEYVKLSKEQLRTWDEVRFIPPTLGARGFGKVRLIRNIERVRFG